MEKPENGTNSCSSCSGFNYCFWSKSMVAVLALPVLGCFAASFFRDPTWQFAAASYAGGLAVWIAAKIDALPFLQRKFRKAACER